MTSVLFVEPLVHLFRTSGHVHSWFLKLQKLQSAELLTIVDDDAEQVKIAFLLCCIMVDLGPATLRTNGSSFELKCYLRIVMCRLWDYQQTFTWIRELINNSLSQSVAHHKYPETNWNE